jgi:hypothetical protein
MRYFFITFESRRCLVTLRQDGNYGMVARQNGDTWERLIIGGAVILASEASNAEETRTYYPALMDRPPWVSTPV